MPMMKVKKKPGIKEMLQSELEKAKKYGLAVTGAEKKLILDGCEGIKDAKEIQAEIRNYLFKFLAKKDPAAAVIVRSLEYISEGYSVPSEIVEESMLIALKTGGLNGFIKGHEYLQEKMEPSSKAKAKQAEYGLKDIEHLLTKFAAVKKLNAKILKNVKKLRSLTLDKKKAEEMGEETLKLVKQRNKLLKELGLPEKYFVSEYFSSDIGGAIHVEYSAYAKELKEGTCTSWMSVEGNTGYIELGVSLLVQQLKARKYFLYFSQSS